MIRAQVMQALMRRRFNVVTEQQLAEHVARVLGEDGFSVQREVDVLEQRPAGAVPVGRIDLVVNERLGVELKIDGSDSSVIRQLHRYAASGQFDELLLVTTRARHGRIIAHRLGVPFSVCVVGAFV